jgi:curved DNA-binding protein CbpA
MTELAQELLGGHFLAKAVEEAWAKLSDENRAKIADKLGEFALTQVSGSHRSFNLERMVDNELQSLVHKIVETRKAEMVEHIRGRLDTVWKERAEKFINQDLERMTQDIKTDIRKKFGF